MIRRQDGFTIVELIITMAVFVVVIAMASQMFAGLLNQFKQQSKIAETNIEGVIGLQLLRADLEQAGYGLPYDIPGVSYLEADNGVATVTAHNEAAYNDAPTAVPRAFVLGDGAGVNLGGLASASDVLVIKATNLGTNDAAHKWGYASNTGALPNTIQTWRDTDGNAIDDENLQNGDRVIVLSPTSTTTQRVLLTSAGAFFTTVTVPSASAGQAFSFQPLSSLLQTL
jgi:prepilin-type N-terminal cleavage/methylation domain-containing protein